MKIVRKGDVPHIQKPQGQDVWYYLFPEYEVHYNEQPPKTTQEWHKHNMILETLYIIDGELVAQWKEGQEVKEEIVQSGDLVEVGASNHTFENRTDHIVKFLVIKQVLSGENKAELIKSDKVTTE